MSVPDPAEPKKSASPHSNIPSALPPSHELESLRVNIADKIKNYFNPLFYVTLAFAIFLCLIIGTRVVTADVIEKMALAASVQVAFGMVIGFACVYLGLMMTWFGIDASYTFGGKLNSGGAKGEVSLKSASPGLLFALGGIILISVSLYKPIEYKVTSGLPTHEENVSKAQGPLGEGKELPYKPPPPIPAK
jgi:hypothetical protein